MYFEKQKAIRGFTEKTQTKSIPSISQVFLYSNFAQYLGAQRLGVFAPLRELFSADPSVTPLKIANYIDFAASSLE